MNKNKSWAQENELIKQWIETSPKPFTVNDIFTDLKSLLIKPFTPENIHNRKLVEVTKKQIHNRIRLLTNDNKVKVVADRRGSIPAVYKYVSQPENKTEKELPVIKEQQTNPKQTEPFISEHEMGRALYDYITFLRQQDTKRLEKIKLLEEQAKQASASYNNLKKEKDDIIAKLNDKIIELNRQVNNRQPNNNRTFSLNEIARVTTTNRQ